jgi:endonuclease G, mitochondrial
MRAKIWGWQKSVGRIEIKGTSLPYGGTGFVVGRNRLMTNRHVAEIFARGLGDRNIQRVNGVRPGFNLAFAPDERGGRMLQVTNVRLVHPYWDMAVLEVEGLPEDAVPLPLAMQDVAAYEGKEAVAIGYPARDWRNDAADQQTVFGGVYGVKQLQPGLLEGRLAVESFSKMVEAVGHDCSTLGGNSGCAVFDLATGDVVALHFGGRYLDTNYAVPISEIARDARVWDAGVTFQKGGAPTEQPPWSAWWTRADSQGTEQAGQSRDGAQAPAVPQPQRKPQPAADDGAIHLTVPLHITVRLGDGPTAIVSSGSGIASAVEKMVEPFRDQEYSSRKGYDPDFLGSTMPMPGPKDPSVLAPTLAGGARLDYQNFSIAMHAKGGWPSSPPQTSRRKTGCGSRRPEGSTPGRRSPAWAMPIRSAGSPIRVWTCPSSCRTCSTPGMTAASTRDTSCAGTMSPLARPTMSCGGRTATAIT